MAVRPVRACDVCDRPITGHRDAAGHVIQGRLMELRAVVVVTEIDGRSHDHDVRAEGCCPACLLTAARAAIERGWAA